MKQFEAAELFYKEAAEISDAALVQQEYAAVTLLNGRKEAHRILCEDMMTSPGEIGIRNADMVLKISCLAPHELSDNERVLLRRLEDDDKSQYPEWRPLVCGLARYRMGEIDEAAKLFEEADSRLTAARYWQSKDGVTLAKTGLAMCLHKKGQPEAIDKFDEARELFEKRDRSFGAWKYHGFTFAAIVLREAAALLGESDDFTRQ